MHRIFTLEKTSIAYGASKGHPFKGLHVKGHHAESGIRCYEKKMRGVDRYIVALGALLGIVTGVLVGMLGVARLLTTVGRDHMLPSFFAYVHPNLGTPLVSTLVLGIITGKPGALFTGP
jgi:hypothetical protein